MTPCDAVARWLDEGRPVAGAGAAHAHAAACRRCAAALAQDDRLAATLGAPAPAPAGFTARVMARVAVTPQQRPRAIGLDLVPLPPALPWWVRASFEPASVLALVVAAVLLWRGPALFALVAGVAAHVTAWLADAGRLPPAPAGDALLQPAALAALVVGLAPLLWLASQALYRWSSGLAGRPYAPPRLH